MMRLIALIALCLCTTTQAVADEALQKAIQDNVYRSEREIARDIYRHPYETLSFFGIKPDMMVAEIQPGGGWYTNILAPYLKEDGSYIAVNYSPNLMQDPQRRQAYQRWGELFTADEEKFGPHAKTAFMGGGSLIAEANSLDMILTMREWHNYIASGLANVLAHEFFRVLKPGGVLGVVQHRANPKNPTRFGQNTGYVREDYLINVMEGAGFKLEAKSEINANPRDTADWPRGVWTLPPSLALRDENRDFYLDIGESDRMTLKFVKPER
ncbi:MAG: methyltransferase [Sphingomonadales bacterium]|jgi:predicted methyltransferase